MPALPRVRLAFDLACPYSYMESAAVERAEDEGRVHVEWVPFQLRPPGTPLLDPRGEHLRVDWTASVYRYARARGIEIHLPPVQPRTTLPLAAWLWADEHDQDGGRGQARALRRAFYEAFFCEGRDISREDELLRAAARAGLDESAVVAAAWARAPRVVELRRSLEPLDVRGVPTLIAGDGRTHWGMDGVARLLAGEPLVPRPR